MSSQPLRGVREGWPGQWDRWHHRGSHPCRRQYAAKISSGVDGRAVGGRVVGTADGRTVGRVVGVGLIGRLARRCWARLGCVVARAFVGRAVGRALGLLDGRGVTRVVVGVVVGPADSLADALADEPGATRAAGSSPSNRPIALRPQRFTEPKSTSALAPATTVRVEGAAYRPTGPVTGLPLPSTQNLQPAGAGGQAGSGRQVFGGTQLRRGGGGQFGGTTNRFTQPPRRRRKTRPRLVDRADRRSPAR